MLYEKIYDTTVIEWDGEKKYISSIAHNDGTVSLLYPTRKTETSINNYGEIVDNNIVTYIENIVTREYFDKVLNGFPYQLGYLESNVVYKYN